MFPEDYENVIGLMNQVHNIHVSGRPDIYKVELDFKYDKYLSYLNDETRLSLIAEIDGIVIGIAFLKIKKDTGNSTQKVAFLDIFCIDNKYSNKGNGKNFIMAIEILLKVRSVTRIELAVWDFNKNAKYFYSKLGFKNQKLILEKSIQ